MKLFSITGASVFAFNPPAIQGAGNIGGFDLEVEDQADSRDSRRWPRTARHDQMFRANTDVSMTYHRPKLTSVFTTFHADSPQVQLNIDRDAVEALHVKLGDVFDTLQILLGSDYVNDFNYRNKSYRVYVQADAPYRCADRQSLPRSTR